MVDENDVIYLSGKMSGVENYNYDKFNQVAEGLRNRGLTVFNPAEDIGGNQEQDRSWYLKSDLLTIVGSCDAVAVLDDWTESNGAKLEVHVAREIGLPVVSAYNPSKELKINSVDIDYTWEDK